MSGRRCRQAAQRRHRAAGELEDARGAAVIEPQRREACSGRTGNLATVQFYVVPGVETFETRDGPQVGVWIGEGASHRIVIAGNYQGNEMVVRHELLHTLLRQTGHPEEYFVNRCRLTWESWNSGH